MGASVPFVNGGAQIAGRLGPLAPRQGMGMRRLATLIGLVAIVGSGAACNPSTPAAELTDPRLILSRTLETTAGLRSMQVRVDLEIRDAARPGEPQGGFAEGVIDLVAGELSLTASATDGSGAFAYIQADGASFARNSANGRWAKVPASGGMVALFLMGGGGAGRQPPDVRKVLASFVDDPDTSVELRGVEDCATGRCYVTQVALPPAQVWKLVVGLIGLDQMPDVGGGLEQPAGLPPLALQVVTDTATLRLVELVASATAEGSTVGMRLRIAAPNEAVSIEPPPPGLVDAIGPDFGVDGGGVVAPAPAPVQPVPVESVGP
jgi:hypothetical protein